MPEPPEGLTVAELTELDSAYRPFPQFAKWPSDARRTAVWNRRLAELTGLAGELDDEALNRARDIAVRAAAWDTGALKDSTKLGAG